MTEFRVWYADGSLYRGYTRRNWRAMPDDGVQVVTLQAPYPDGRRPWVGVEDRQIWTGDETYNLYGWGEKRGSLIADEDYAALWWQAFYGE